MAIVCLQKECKDDGLFQRLQLSKCSHQLIEQPQKADLVLFCGSDFGDFSDVRSSAVFRLCSHKSVIVYEGDYFVPYVCGLAPNVDRISQLLGLGKSCHYTHTAFWNDLDFEQEEIPDRLYSFVGRALTHPVRKKLLHLLDDRALLIDTDNLSTGDHYINPGDWRKRFLDSFKCSKFILCPRGFGPSSYRVFESLRAGRVPVIISDAWVAPEKIDWHSCSVRVRERDWRSVPKVLRDFEGRWPEMASAARAVFERNFSLSASLDYLIERAFELLRNKSVLTRILGPLNVVRYKASPDNLKRAIRTKLRLR